MSKKILILGATGSIGEKVRKTLLNKTDYELTLFSTRANSLKVDNNREVAISGNILKKEELGNVIKGKDVVFAALSGNLEKMAQNIVDVMKEENVKRVIFISSMGIYNEILAHVGSGNLKNNPILQSYRNAADIIENSGLEYTVIRPGWFDEGSDDYEITKKGEPFGGHDVSRQAIANLVLRLIDEDGFGENESLGINRP